VSVSFDDDSVSSCYDDSVSCLDDVSISSLDDEDVFVDGFSFFDVVDDERQS
jgi:hypothetical protein